MTVPRAEWNPRRQLWETGQVDLFSGEAEPFTETWPTAGATRSGKLLFFRGDRR